jgi:serine acetyltransferase
MLTGSDIHPNARIGPGLLIPAPCSVNVSGVAGANAMFLPRAGMGIIPSPRDVGAGPGLPVLGDEFVSCPGGGPLGAIRIGDGALIGPRCFRSRDVAPGFAAMRADAGRVLTGEAARGDEAPRRPSPLQPCGHRSLRRSVRDLRADLAHHHRARTGSSAEPGVSACISALLTNSCLLMAVHRCSHWLWRIGLAPLAVGLSAINQWIFKITIHPSTCIGGGCFLPHPAGVVLEGVIGPELTVFASGLCVRETAAEAREESAPRVGAGVTIGGQGMIVGPRVVGDGAMVAATVTLNTDLAAQQIAMSSVVRFEDRPRRIPPASPEAPNRPLAGPRRALRTADRARLMELRCGRPRSMPLRLRLSPANIAVSLYRASEAAHARGDRRFAQFVRQLNQLLTGADLDPTSRVGPGLAIPYPAGVSMFATAGRNLTMLALSGVDADPERVATPAWLGDDVTIGHHGLVYGPVHVGDRAHIRAGAIAWSDVPSGAHVVPPVVRRRGVAGEGP